MNIQDRQIRYSVIWGIVTVALGVLASMYIAPETQGSLWKQASYIYLNAHGVQVIGDSQPNSMFFIPGEVSVLEGGPQQVMRVVAVALAAVSAILVSVSMGWTTRMEYIFKNSLYGAAGYTAAIAALLLVSNARPGLRIAMIAVILGAVALYVGGKLVGKATEDFFMIGFVSIGGLFMIGLVIVLVGWAFVYVMLPVVTTAIVGAIVAGFLVHTARNLQFR